MKFRPLHDRVVVRRIEEDQKTAGGIIIPDTAAEKPQTGEVIAVGPGARGETGKFIEALDVKSGDKVLFGKWSGTEVKIDNRGPPDHEGVRHHGRASVASQASEAWRDLRRSPLVVTQTVFNCHRSQKWLQKT